MAFDPLTSVLNIGNTLIDRLLPDKAANDAAKAQLVQMQVAGELQQITGQLDIDKVEAASNSVFVAGWRPAVGWVCVAGLAYQFVSRPLLQLVVNCFHSQVQLVSLDMGTLMVLLTGMLGFGGMRSFDKLQGTGNGH